MIEVTLPSGVVLRITPAPFADAKALYMAIMEEGKSLKLDPSQEVDVNLRKDIYCALLSSKKIEACVWACMKRALYGKEKITEDLFDAEGEKGEKAREDYLTMCYEVGQVNVSPFMKSLYAQFSSLMGVLPSSPA